MPSNNPADQTAADAAGLLLRLGLAVAFVLTPLAFLFSTRAIFVLTPIGAALTFIAGAMLAPRLRLREVFDFAFSSVALAAMFLAFWAAVSLLWTPFPADSGTRLFKIVFTFLCVPAVAAALPARSKASNLYLLPLGLVLTAFAAIAFETHIIPSNDASPDRVVIARAVEAMLLLLWPAAAALGLRNRVTVAASLAAVVLAAAVAIHAPAALEATAAAALAFSLALGLGPVSVGRWFGAAGAAGFIFAPIVPLLFGTFVEAGAPLPLLGLKIWNGMLVADGLRVITGHGFNFVGAGLWRQYLPPQTPHSILFEIWTDLGLVGALGGAALIYACYQTAAIQSPRLAPYWLGGLTYIAAMGFFGGATLDLWWITAVALVLAAVILVTRGNYKTVRPTAPRKAA